MSKKIKKNLKVIQTERLKKSLAVVRPARLKSVVHKQHVKKSK
ncbi:MAG: hypothetical protein WC579_00190 [Candidatus Paceibacterota bacterium]|jgi:hypothetical protein|nr:hypothetical protein [Candidatus Paceibacterota bacterium]HPD55497.1 hypothetical protein [Candidatus Paceibacterota bacterium]HQM35018.1 hypothetical protein [Candidatus Paceibacterota bacterium]